MAYFSTEPASARRNVTGKNCVWEFLRLPKESNPANRRQPAQPRRKIDLSNRAEITWTVREFISYYEFGMIA